MTTNLRGILAPALTAVTDDFQIHEERTLAHFKWLLENGCDGLVVFGTTSEANSFSVIERRRLLERAVSVGINAKKLIVGTGCCSLADSIELTKHAVQVGCAGALTLPPFYYKGVSDALLKYPPIPALKAIISKTRDDTAWKNVRPPLLPLTESEFVGLTTELTAAGFEWPKTTGKPPDPVKFSCTSDRRLRRNSESPLAMNACRDTVLAIIPAYSEGRFIAQVARQALQYVKAVLVIDDGSSDCTASEAAAAGAKVIRHSTNLGKGAALKTGLKYAARDDVAFFLFLDGDGQHDPSDIPAFFEAINSSQAELIVGNRMNNLESMPLVRRWTNQFMSWQIGKICKMTLPDSQCGFRLVRKELLPVLLAAKDRFEFESESIILAVHQGFRIGFVPIRTIYTDERSKIRPFCDTVRYIRLMSKYRHQIGCRRR